MADQAPDLEIANGTVITNGGCQSATLQIRGGRVAGLVAEPTGLARDFVDASGLLVLPGMVDQHVHFMETADASRETWAQGSAAAATGGVTTVIEHTHGAPVLDAADLSAKREFVSGRSYVDFGLAAHAFPGTLGNVKELVDAGAAFVKAFRPASGSTTPPPRPGHAATQELNAGGETTVVATPYERRPSCFARLQLLRMD